MHIIHTPALYMHDVYILASLEKLKGSLDAGAAAALVLEAAQGGEAREGVPVNSTCFMVKPCDIHRLIMVNDG